MGLQAGCREQDTHRIADTWTSVGGRGKADAKNCKETVASAWQLATGGMLTGADPAKSFPVRFSLPQRLLLPGACRPPAGRGIWEMHFAERQPQAHKAKYEMVGLKLKPQGKSQQLDILLVPQ